MDFNITRHLNGLLVLKINVYMYVKWLYEPRCEKTGLRGFRPGPTQTGLYSHMRWLKA